jgi:hypothetical protein
MPRRASSEEARPSATIGRSTRNVTKLRGLLRGPTGIVSQPSELRETNVSMPATLHVLDMDGYLLAGAGGGPRRGGQGDAGANGARLSFVAVHRLLIENHVF